MDSFEENSKALNRSRNYYLTSLFEDDFYFEIIRSAAFQRLKNISFLGAIDYTGELWSTDETIKFERSRYSHSLGVASLALFVSKKRNYSKELEQHIVSAALLHDVGHAPLSHSLEAKFLDVFNIGHHQQGRSLVLGETSKGKELNRVLKRKIDPNVTSRLIEGDDALEGSDLFSSPINIDTIDGILRASTYLAEHEFLCPLKIAEASFLISSEKRFSYLDSFWQQKGLIYKNFIQSSIGLVADKISQAYFEENKKLFDYDDFLGDEISFRNKHSALFGRLEKVGINLENKFLPNEVDVVEREYEIDNSSNNYSRFICKKKLKTKNLVSEICNLKCA